MKSSPAQKDHFIGAGGQPLDTLDIHSGGGQPLYKRGSRGGPVNFSRPVRATLYLLYTSLCTEELNAIRKHKCFLCSPFYVKGVSLGYVGRIKT